MKSTKEEAKVIVLIISLLLVISVKLSVFPLVSSSEVSFETVVVYGTKIHPFSYKDNYIFESETSLEIEAPQKLGWNFEYLWINFGCEVGGVTGANVSDIFTIDNGYIDYCGVG